MEQGKIMEAEELTVRVGATSTGLPPQRPKVWGVWVAGRASSLSISSMNSSGEFETWRFAIKVINVHELFTLADVV